MLLKFLRKRKNMKRIMWALAILIIPAFVIWGAGTSGKNKGDKPDYAGKVFGKKISYDDYYKMWNVARDFAVKSFGNNVPVEFIDQITWSRILLIEEAKRQNLRVTDQEVLKEITSFQAFQRNGSFDKKFYKSMLGDTARSFEEKLRDDILISKLKDRITSGIRVSDEEVKNEYKKKFEKIKSSYAMIPFSDFEKDAQYTENELKSFYEKNKDSFKKSEQMNIKYIEIAFAKFNSEVDIKDEQIKRFFEEHITEFKKSGAEETPALDDTVKNIIRERLATQRTITLAEEAGYRALDQVSQKKNLEEPAAANSLEVKETGFFSANEEIPGIGWSYEFAKAGSELEKNQINNALIKTEKGLYIIQLKDKKEPYIPDYAEVEGAVKKAFVKERSVELAEKKAEKIHTDLSNDIKLNERFEDAVKKYGLEAKQTDFISRDSYIPEIGPAKEFAGTAFSIKIGDISAPLKTLQGWAIIQPAEFNGIDEIKYIEEKDKFKENILSDKKNGEFDRFFQDLQKRSGFVSYTQQK
ncbi:MAG: SurA N-terminal domain-containing protein [Candidatus Omnitrophota bacterium]|nr:SurA N-terminal domain-containing protein [Candidatus Omnitrophota bacterium]